MRKNMMYCIIWNDSTKEIFYAKDFMEARAKANIKKKNKGMGIFSIRKVDTQQKTTQELRFDLWVGHQVKKRSRAKFMSGSKINTVAGLINHPEIPDMVCFTFLEDDSYVNVYQCELVDSIIIL